LSGQALTGSGSRIKRRDDPVSVKNYVSFLPSGSEISDKGAPERAGAQRKTAHTSDQVLEKEHPVTKLTLKTELEDWPLVEPFIITGYTFTSTKTLKVTIGQDGVEGHGEAAGVYYYQDLPEKALDQVEALRSQIEAGITREELRDLLPGGCARNAVDCALWELECKLTGKTAWQVAGLPEAKPLLTTFTLGAESPEQMGARALTFPDARALKLKLTGDESDAERVRLVRKARPDVWIGVDANQGFTRESLTKLMPTLIEADVKLIEQPFKIGRDADLDGFESPIPFAADESVQTLKDVAGLVGRYQVMNIKLDKSGGLTEAMDMAREAKRLGLKVMVGNMTGTSLAMAPAFVVGQLCDVVDLDGPIYFASDRAKTIVYKDGNIDVADDVWGATAG
jgi:L-alanine-DL-glutamate epimerase-like enolase superfamily enzyme